MQLLYKMFRFPCPWPLQMAAGEEQVKIPKTNAIKGGTMYLITAASLGFMVRFLDGSHVGKGKKFYICEDCSTEVKWKSKDEKNICPETSSVENEGKAGEKKTKTLWMIIKQKYIIKMGWYIKLLPGRAGSTKQIHKAISSSPMFPKLLTCFSPHFCLPSHVA